MYQKSLLALSIFAVSFASAASKYTTPQEQAFSSIASPRQALANATQDERSIGNLSTRAPYLDRDHEVTPDETLMPKNTLFIPDRLNRVSALRHEQDGFVVETPRGDHKIRPEFTDKNIRGLSGEQIMKAMATKKAFLELDKQDDTGEYSIKLNNRLKGGGPGGAMIGTAAGRFLVHGGYELLSWGVSGLAGWGASVIGTPAFGIGIGLSVKAGMKSLTPLIHVISTKASLGLGVLGAALIPF